MKHLIGHSATPLKSSAKVVDGTLIISLPDAKTPTVWRLDLGQVRASAIEVRTNELMEHVLVLKTPKGDVQDIAPYDNRDKAIAALMAVSRAMEQAHGQIKPGQFGDSAQGGDRTETPRHYLPALYKHSQPASPLGKLLAGVLAVILLIVMISFMINLGPKQPASLASLNLTGGGAAPVAGAPVSADDFLRNR